MTTIDLQDIISLRQEIHQYPEVSGEEKETADRIKKFLSQFNPDQIISEIGGHGLIAQWKGEEEGPSVTIRAELDGLPIQEISDLEYKSTKQNTGHLCGHDGHMMMVAALAKILSKEKPKKGKVNLLFQPAEETGQGAEAMLNDSKFEDIQHEYIFALHNLPGYPKGEIILKKETFASASKGIIIELNGKTSHAAEPENGISPAQAVAEIIQQIKVLPDTINELEDFSLVTIVHAKIGERAFGTTPGQAVVMATLRAYKDKDLITLDNNARKICEEISKKHNLSCDIEDTEVFSSTINSPDCVELIENAASKNGFETQTLEAPFRWSEDFGLFSQAYKGAMFGLGSGEETPSLHNPDYDFPDDIMDHGIKMFDGILKQLVY